MTVETVTTHHAEPDHRPTGDLHRRHWTDILAVTLSGSNDTAALTAAGTSAVTFSRTAPTGPLRA
jgi:hypothetical protein